MSGGRKRMGLALILLAVIFGAMYFCTKPETEPCANPNQEFPVDTTEVIIEDIIYF